MSRAIMQQALDALRRVGEYGDIYRHKNTEQSPYTQIYEAIDAINVELAKPEQEPVAWRNAAIRLGEDLYSVGPNGYYDMTAKQWLDWALSVVNTAPQQLAKREQEPIAWITDNYEQDRSATTFDAKMAKRWRDKGWQVAPLYEAPPRKEWAGLTDDEINKIANSPQPVDTTSNGYVLPFAHAIETKLKEKNT